jgi:beta-exotoxin I transport system permease protein
MNAALWKKTIRESRWLLAGGMVFMFVVHWLRVWIASFFSVSALEGIFSFMPDVVETMLPVTYAQMASTAGRIAVAYDDPIVLLLVTVWGISRGSDTVSGELNRGTMEMVLAQPVTRLGVLGSQAAVTLAGAVLLAATALLGTAVGLATVTLDQVISLRVFLPAAINLFAITAFLAGLSTMVSAGSNYRARVIGIVGGFYAVSMVVKIVGRMAPGWEWLTYCSFFTPFEPQLLVANTARAWSMWTRTAAGAIEMGGLGYDSILIGLGLAFYLVASVVFCHRDLPAPL